MPTPDESVLLTTLYARCAECGDASFPVHLLTPCGHGAPVTLHPFTESGEVYSWTRTHGEDGTVVLAMADFLAGDLRVTAPVVGGTAVQIGDHVVVRAGGGYDFVLVAEPSL